MDSVTGESGAVIAALWQYDGYGIQHGGSGVVTSGHDALQEKGYNPINQIIGYILSEDPTYITTHRDARKKIRKLDRDDILQSLLRNYLK